MKRRDFLGMFGVAAAWPEVALAQQDNGRRIPTVGFIGFASAAIDAAIHEPFRKALADLGYVEGRSIIVEIRTANGEVARGHAIIDEFVALPVDVLFAPGPAAARAAVRKTKIPVVAIALPAVQSDPELFQSLARPGGTLDLSRRAAGYVDQISQGAEARRDADTAADQVRADRQPQDGAGAGADNAVNDPCADG